MNAVPISVAELRKQLITQAQTAKDALPPITSSRIALKKDGFVLPDDSTSDHIVGIVIGVAYMNVFYDKPYRPGVIEEPACWALSNNANNLAPLSTVNRKQSDTCEGCAKNQWGSAGKGKACRNKIRLAITPAEVPKVGAKPTVFTMALPPTSTGSFLTAYRKLKVPIETVVCRFSLSSLVDYPQVETAIIEFNVADDLIACIMEARDIAAPLLARGFDYD